MVEGEAGAIAHVGLQDGDAPLAMFINGLTTKSAHPKFLLPSSASPPVILTTPTAALGTPDRVSGPLQGIRRGGRRASLTGAQRWAELLPTCFSSWFCQVFQALLPHPISQPPYILVSLTVLLAHAPVCVYTLPILLDDQTRKAP